MPAEISTQEVWKAVEKELFAVISWVSGGNEARSAGIVYVTKGRKLYLCTGKETWKARQIAANPHISVTIPISKHIPFAPWFRIPSATITFCGHARTFPAEEATPELRKEVFRFMADDWEMISDSCIIEITPEKDFITYGVGIPMYKMREPHEAGGRVAVS